MTLSLRRTWPRPSHGRNAKRTDVIDKKWANYATTKNAASILKLYKSLFSLFGEQALISRPFGLESRLNLNRKIVDLWIRDVVSKNEPHTIKIDQIMNFTMMRHPTFFYRLSYFVSRNKPKTKIFGTSYEPWIWNKVVANVLSEISPLESFLFNKNWGSYESLNLPRCTRKHILTWRFCNFLGFSVKNWSTVRTYEKSEIMRRSLC